MRVLISGGTGMIGARLTRSLLADGHQVWVLTRRVQSARLPAGAQGVGWDGCTTQGWGELVNRMDAVVNLVGERLAEWPWTKARRQRFRDSRVNGGRALTEAIQAATRRPQVLLQASGVNYYGPHGEEVLREADPAGEDELARLCLDWEVSTQPVEALGVRRVVIRSAIVLAAEDGILPLMALPVRSFVGGPLGGGRQGLAWIHVDDELGAIRFLLENERAQGPFNLTVPQPISSGDFLRALARVLHRPYWLRVPGFALQFALGGMSALLLAGQYILPQRLLELGYRFTYEKVEEALRDLLKK